MSDPLLREIDEFYSDHPELLPEGADIILFRKRGYMIVKDDGEIHALIVHKDHQGQGIARQLIAAARALGYYKLWGMVDIKNERAIGFHKAIGSRETGRFAKFEITI
jgi:ribosomal protein S18 acetylase RimI-like enzyme